VDRFLIATDCSPARADRPTVERLLADGRLLWLDVGEPDPESLAWLREVFGVHPVALKAVAEFGQRPKAETFGDMTYLVTYGARGRGGALTEVHCFYSTRFLVTMRCDRCPALDELREHLTALVGQDGQLPGGQLPGPRRPPQLILLHHIMSGLFDSFFPVLSDFDDRIDELQERIFVRPGDRELVELFSMQRWLVGLRKLVTPQRDMMASLVSGMTSLPGMVPESEPYVRDLYDHLIRISDLVDSYRDLISGAMDAYLSIMSNRLNTVMKQLAIIATVFLPLSFLTGFFGQNFGWLQEHLGSLAAFVVFGLGAEAVVVGVLFLLFRQRGWISLARSPGPDGRIAAPVAAEDWTQRAGVA